MVVTANFYPTDDAVPKDKYQKNALALLNGKKATTLNLFLDETADDLAEQLRVLAAPAIYVFDRQGRWSAFGGVTVKGAGDLDHAKLESFVEQLLKESPGK